MQAGKRVFSHHNDLRQVPFCPVVSNDDGMVEILERRGTSLRVPLFQRIRLFFSFLL